MTSKIKPGQVRVGDVFGRLTFVRQTEAAGSNKMGVFRCDCGSETKPSRISSVVNGYIKSCGCAQTRGLCTVDGCARPHFGRGYCLLHYKRWTKGGDPLSGGTFRGAPKRFIADLLMTTSDDCVAYPFCRTSDGYGRIRMDGKTVNVHAYVAERVHGPRPSSGHEVCHSCGKGHEGCVNPRHLYWGTRSDNVQDAIRHGTFGGGYVAPRGEKAIGAKFSDALVAEVKMRLARGERQVTIAKATGMSQGHVSAINVGKLRSEVRPLPHP